MNIKEKTELEKKAIEELKRYIYVNSSTYVELNVQCEPQELGKVDIVSKQSIIQVKDCKYYEYAINEILLQSTDKRFYNRNKIVYLIDDENCSGSEKAKMLEACKKKDVILMWYNVPMKLGLVDDHFYEDDMNILKHILVNKISDHSDKKVKVIFNDNPYSMHIVRCERSEYNYISGPKGDNGNTNYYQLYDEFEKPTYIIRSDDVWFTRYDKEKDKDVVKGKRIKEEEIIEKKLEYKILMQTKEEAEKLFNEKKVLKEIQELEFKNGAHQKRQQTGKVYCYCGKRARKKTSRNGNKFWGCSRWKKTSDTFPTSEDSGCCYIENIKEILIPLDEYKALKKRKF